MSANSSQFAASPYRVFLSDVHGQGDVFDYLVQEKFGIVEKIVIDASEHDDSRAGVLRHYLLPRQRTVDAEYSAVSDVVIMMDLLLTFKNERRFWPVCVDAFVNCSWLLPVVDQCAIQAEVSEVDLEAVSRLDAFDRISVCNLIAESVHSLIAYRVQLVGDIFDRGASAPHIIDQLEKLPAVGIQWGNHDVLWMGAASGSLECIATAVRLCIRYGHVETLTDDYSIDLSDLATLAEQAYADDSCEQFMPLSDAAQWSQLQLAAMHKAIAMIQFKLEHHIVERNPDYSMESRLLLNKIDYTHGQISLQGETVDLIDSSLPTVNPHSPTSLTDAEWSVIEKLKQQFVGSERLQRHVNFLFANGSLVDSDGEYLLFHGCMPVDDDLEFLPAPVAGRQVTGRAMFDAFELQMRKAYSRRHSTSCKYLSDVAWYLWCGPNSPLFGKEQMTTFERYFIANKHFHKEGKNPYFDARNDANFVAKVAEELSGDAGSIIINGHVPVKLKAGESPRYANNQLLCIDGGFSQAYRSRTGAAGMVLIANDQSAQLFKLDAETAGFSFNEI
ncbi:fructose-bisphosphatase class III [Gilvimarinus sp. 1_MG-2023]|uniref:fructose-bisphosphatase class III n=1 Tax=Gilvimarinus sp. 1_MG-2023 TaxID=3062638 RepID=UPI0026E13201|nr:fructose-bisphosphatase class III [Gilvimarinus sp. 1_MG-2023]MDO6746428.1 fructose-bisphosphatase class III [Gilvimarinus sp. 1_MG-2023]